MFIYLNSQTIRKGVVYYKPTNSIKGYPTVIIHSIIKILHGTPFIKKSFVFKYGFPTGFSCEIAVMFGNPETGNPIAAEHTNAVPYLEKYELIYFFFFVKFVSFTMTKIRGFGSGNCVPIFATIGNTMSAATV